MPNNIPGGQAANRTGGCAVGNFWVVSDATRFVKTALNQTGLVGFMRGIHT
jgi:hypothetical protein